jgi:hypothetical protein
MSAKVNSLQEEIQEEVNFKGYFTNQNQESMEEMSTSTEFETPENELSDFEVPEIDVDQELSELEETQTEEVEDEIENIENMESDWVDDVSTEIKKLEDGYEEEK